MCTVISALSHCKQGRAIVMSLPMDLYLAKEFYAPMGLQRTMYLPQKYSKQEIMPTAAKISCVVRTCVAMCMMRLLPAWVVYPVMPVSSPPPEVAKIYQMIERGEWNGKRYLSEATCRLFTTETSAISRRGLGLTNLIGRIWRTVLCCSLPLPFMGIPVSRGLAPGWIQNGTVYVFLSNRLCPKCVEYKTGWNEYSHGYTGGDL